MSAGHAKELPGQRTWLEYGFEDLRSLATELRSAPPAELPAAADMDSAVELVAQAFGLADPGLDRTAITTPAGIVTVLRDKLAHVVEKRQDARERYTHHAVMTLSDPFEVWKVDYDNGDHRLAFIGAFEGKRQMLVIVSTINGQVLWNFMHCDAKSLNKHRHGIPVFQRHPA